jgi:5'-3' exonuclease
LKEFENKRVAIDISGCIHRSGVVHARDYFLGTLKHLPWCDYCDGLIHILRENNITPIVVFDGEKRLPEKKNTTDKRRSGHFEAVREAMLLEAEENVEDAQKQWMRAFSVTPEMEKQVMELLERERIQYRVAEHEADFEIGKLFHAGEVDAAISEDSDLFGYGVDKLLFKFKLNGSFEYLDCERSTMHVAKKKRGIDLELSGLTRLQRALIATFCGNDYIHNIPKVGIKKVYSIAKECSTLDEMIQKLGCEPEDGYFEKARRVFKIFFL